MTALSRRHRARPVAAVLLVAACTSAPDPGGWIDIGAVDDVLASGVVYLRGPGVFVVVVDGDFVGLLDDAKHIENERVLFCAPADGFESPFHGEHFDRQGRYRDGPAHSDMDRVEVRVHDGRVEVDPSLVTRFPPGRRSAEATPRPGGPCRGGEHPAGFFDDP